MIKAPARRGLFLCRFGNSEPVSDAPAPIMTQLQCYLVTVIGNHPKQQQRGRARQTSQGRLHMRIARLAVGMPAAATVTFFLFLGMMTLITVEYRQEAPIPDYDIDIFPTVEPLPPPEIRPELPTTQIDPPPPPIRLEVTRAAVDAAP
jgi:hypothetical protein